MYFKITWADGSNVEKYVDMFKELEVFLVVLGSSQVGDSNVEGSV